MEKKEIPLKSDSNTPDDGIELLPLKRFFNQDFSDMTYTKELKFINDWAKEKGYDKETLNEKLREIRYRVGKDDDKSLIKVIYQYIRINQSIQDLVHKERMLEK